MQDTVLEVTHLTKTFGLFTAVNDISFSIADGEILGLLGLNGAGKTTTIHMLLGVMKPTRGTIAFFGKDFKNNRENILKQINFSSTYISFPHLFKVSEILEIFARLYEIPDKKKRIAKLLKEFEIEHLVGKSFVSLSAGEKTRLLLTKSFLNYPRLILLDEPTASLDPDIAIKVREFLKKEQKEYGVSMLFTSHNMSEVEEMCDRVIILHHGNIIAEDSPHNLAKKISESYVRLLIQKDAEKATILFNKLEIPYEANRFSFIIPIDEKRVADFLMLLAKKHISYEEISIDKPDLEDYFLQVVERKNM
ncbi:MAG: hypothetical protein A3J69_02480 [Candidatus Levybacteria bacterium RIFCSPHIGHO2_02_FULL_42_12]|nr:MAG: hypothetical protein A3J69_02480 [Candidatus Levybacteria bacterium RIFCSPHIGHO2_02_FULL_42_12]OGH42810.1 MAG: hypothetical protein A3B53_01715 [Candidatus Levybacteria bacterium RIFCSPLOWO2_01_FULL_42_15]